MSFNISNFSAQINQHGLAKDHLFEVRITLPPALIDLEQEFSTRDMTFFCNSVSIPELGLSLADYKNIGIGYEEQRPRGYTMGGLTGTFLIDSKLKIRTFFERWMYSIVNLNVMDEYILKDKQGKFPFEFAYKSDYAGILDVKAFDETGNETFSWKFSGVFPTVIPSHTYNWSSSGDSVYEMTIGFGFDKMQTSSMEAYTNYTTVTNEPNSNIPQWMTSQGSTTYTRAIGSDASAIPNTSSDNGNVITDEEGNYIYVPPSDESTVTEQNS